MKIHFVNEPNSNVKATISETFSRKNESSDTGNRTPICSVRANCASHYTISDFVGRIDSNIQSEVSFQQGAGVTIYRIYSID